MDNREVAGRFLDKICAVDSTLKHALEDGDAKSHVINTLSNGFEKIVNVYPHLLGDIQRRIVKYHIAEGKNGKITDFIELVDWYSMVLDDEPKEYWDQDGRYYSLRMSEVITMFLIARHNR